MAKRKPIVVSLPLYKNEPSLLAKLCDLELEVIAMLEKQGTGDDAETRGIKAVLIRLRGLLKVKPAKKVKLAFFVR